MARVLWVAFALLACRPTVSGDGAPQEQARSADEADHTPSSRVDAGGEVPGPGADATGGAIAGVGSPPGPNEATRLIAAADRITGVVVVDADRKPLGELPDGLLDGLRSALVAGPADDLTLTTPPWDVALQISVDGTLAFVAIPVGIDRARLSPAHPYDPRYADTEGRLDASVQEVVVGEAVHEAIGALVGPPTAKEFQLSPSQGKATSLDTWYEKRRDRVPAGK